METFNKVMPATRLYLYIVSFCTLAHLIEFPTPNYLSLDIFKLYQIWRPFTSMAYFGTPSMSMANNLYFLIMFGQSMERETGSITHAWFLTVQTILLALFGSIFSFPFQSKAFISAIVYCSSRRHPMDEVYVF